MEPKPLKVVILGDHHRPTGRTKHLGGGEAILSPAEMHIVQYPEDPGFYLLHLDKDGIELTDTYHETLLDCFYQAEWEFNVKPHEWQDSTFSSQPE